MTRVQRQLDLASWLRSLPPTENDDGHLLLGGTGHLLLSPLEQAQATRHLETRVFPGLLSGGRPARVTLLTGLAPGADLLFKRLAAGWLAAAGIPFEAVALLPVPVAVLIDDWEAKSMEVSTPVEAPERAAMRSNLDALLADCDTVVDLLPPDVSPEQLAEEGFRQQQYRRLAACLAEQADVLIALLRAENPLQPGGTAEVVEWRRDLRRVPREFSTLALRRPLADPKTLVIDPALAMFDDWPATCVPAEPPRSDDFC